MKISARAALLASLLALTAAPSAQAYVLDTDGNGHALHWQSFPVGYWLASGSTAGGTAGEQAVAAAFKTWSDASTVVQYDFSGYVSQGAQAYDGKNVVYWVSHDWPYDPTLAALTFRYYDTGDGHILDADIIFNGSTYAWSVGGSSYDIQNSATHETGHFCGLGHSTDPEATMFATTTAGETKKRSLAADDLSAIQALYGGVTALVTSVLPQLVPGPTDSAPSGVGGGGGGCSLGRDGRMDDTSTIVGTIGLLTLLRLRRRRFAAEGDRSISQASVR